MGNAVKVAIAGGVFLAVFLLSQVFFYAARPRSPEETQAELEQQVASLKQTLPQKVHPIVTWFDVEAGQQTIIYKYKIHAPRAQVMAKRTDLEEQMKGSWAGWAAKLTLPRGVDVKCELYDDNGSYMFSLDLE
jgi:hypothetical protein